MHRTYAVTWQEAEGIPHSGKLELRSVGLSLEGGQNGHRSSLVVPYEELVGMTVAPARDRLDGRPTLVLERPVGGTVRIAGVVQPGVVAELAERVASLRLGRPASHSRGLVVVPIQPGKEDEVRLLLEQGPPFDPEQIGLERHQVFMTESEVVFLFEARPGSPLRNLLEDAGVLAMAAAWRECVAGPPRIAKECYSWSSEAGDTGVFFSPTPGPGDSDGGDVYSP